MWTHLEINRTIDQRQTIAIPWKSAALVQKESGIQPPKTPRAQCRIAALRALVA
jgi:hypothetical protein